MCLYLSLNERAVHLTPHKPAIAKAKKRLPTKDTLSGEYKAVFFPVHTKQISSPLKKKFHRTETLVSPD